MAYRRHPPRRDARRSPRACQTGGAIRAFCAIAAALRQTSKIKKGNVIFEDEYVQLNMIRSRQLHDALEKLTKAIREVEAVLETMRVEHDPLASHISSLAAATRTCPIQRAGSGARLSAHLSWQTACALGFRGDRDEWKRLMGARIVSSRAASELIHRPTRVVTQRGHDVRLDIGPSGTRGEKRSR